MEHCVDAGFLAVIGLCSQRGPEHILRTGRVLDDAALRRQIAAQNGDAAVGALGVVKVVDDVGAGNRKAEGFGLLPEDPVAVLIEAVFLQVFQVFPEGLSGYGQDIQMEHGLDFLHHPRDAARIVEILGGPVARRPDVQQVVRSAVHPVEGVGVDGKAELVRNRRQMHRGIGGAGDGRVDHDGVFKTLHGHDVFGSDALLHQFHQLSARLTGCFGKLRRRRRHQGSARQHQAQGFGHDLHGGGGSHKGTGSAAWTGIVFVVFELLGGDHTCFFPGVVLADLFQRQQLVDRTGRILCHILLRQHVRFHDTAGDNNGAHLFEPSDAHQHGGHGLVAAGNEHAAVKAGGIGLRLHQIDDRVPVRQRVIDSVMSLGDPVAHVGRKIARGFAAALIDTLHSLLDKAVQMRGTRVAVAEGALHHNLGLVQVFDLPAHSHPERIHLRSKFTYFLTFQHTFRLQLFRPDDLPARVLPVRR